MKVLYIGPGLFIKIFAEKIGGRGATVSYYDLNVWKKINFFHRIKIISRFDLVHYYWGRRICIEEIMAAKMLGVKIVYTFIGSDVTRILKAKKWKRMRARVGMKMVHEVTAVAPWLKEELKTIDIESRVLPAAIAKPQDQIVPLPEKFTALSYVPPERLGFYGWDIILKLARDIPEIEFQIIGNNGDKLESAPNIHFNGWVDSAIPYIQKASVFLRLTEHDGLARTVIEALSCCRHVIWTYEFPFCQTNKDYESIRLKLQELIKNPHPNYGADEYVQNHFSEEKVMAGWEELYASLLL